jgi:AAHS family benzoate transporter-like MFS transporter
MVSLETMMVGGILVGTLSDLHGRKPLFIGCFTLFTACTIITTFTPTPAWFGLSRFVAGLRASAR